LKLQRGGSEAVWRWQMLCHGIGDNIARMDYIFLACFETDLVDLAFPYDCQESTSGRMCGTPMGDTLSLLALCPRNMTHSYIPIFGSVSG
jgi:hypothetical protein